MGRSSWGERDKWGLKRGRGIAARRTISQMLWALWLPSLCGMGSSVWVVLADKWWVEVTCVSSGWESLNCGGRNFKRSSFLGHCQVLGKATSASSCMWYSMSPAPFTWFQVRNQERLPGRGGGVTCQNLLFTVCLGLCACVLGCVRLFVTPSPLRHLGSPCLVCDPQQTLGGVKT